MAEENKEFDESLEQEIAKAEDEALADSVAEDSKEQDDSAETKQKEEDPKRFGKKKDKKQEKLEAENADLKDQLVRRLAEFENFRKRSEKEKSQMFEIGAKSVIEKLLPVLDNFERGLDGIPEEEKDTPFVQGVELVYKQLLTAFDELGVKPIEAVGAEFDPNLHNAVMMVDDEELESGVVAEEMQKGYLYRENVVRHSMVKVVN
ncbi:MAG: nucleotide exchange factor GrpE [Clostridiaceae bacterium]|nr:nucleotide exchange factor GrpE [Clostridiaceae bacterium]